MMIALPASIMASGFADELRRRRFLVTWGLVARVPLFAKRDAAHIAELVAILKPHTVEAGDLIITAGELADCMYFIVSGEVDVLVTPPVRLYDGDFFGEVALLEERRRIASVRAQGVTHLLVLMRRDFRTLLERDSALRHQVAQVAAERRASATDRSLCPSVSPD